MFWFVDQAQIDRIERLLADIHSHLQQRQKENTQMALDLKVLTDEVARLETVEGSAVLLLHTLVDEVAALKNDPVALQALVDRIKAADDTLAAAVVENTPAGPPAPVV